MPVSTTLREIRFLRAKIDEAFGIKLIHTVRGVGYVIREESE